MKMLTAFVGICILAAALAQGRSAYICEVLYPNFCPNNNAACASDPNLHFNALPYGFSHYNLVSFGNMYAPSGDVEGRTAVRNNVDLTSYSIGYQIRTSGASAWDISLPYSMVVGGDAKWHGGAILPDGSGFPWAGAKEYAFVGGDSSNTDTYLQADITGHCPTANPGCLNADFDYAQGYYRLLSQAFATMSSNVVYDLATWGTISVTCDSMADAQYVLNLTPDQFSTITFWSFSNCNPNSGLIVNIAGSGNQVRFAGATQTFFKNAKTLYNVVSQPSNTPSVRVEVGVNGNLLAPDSNYNQPGLGVFIGQVIVANVQQVLQINYIYCAPPAPSNNHNNSVSLLCPAWEVDCTGLALPLDDGNTYSFRDYNAVVFGDFSAGTGDIEGRLAVQGNCKFGSGYSIGYQLQTATGQPDRHVEYSVICGRDAAWGSGAIYPQGNGIPFPGLTENMFVGGTFVTNETDLNDRRTGGPCASVGCFDANFNAAKTCYQTYSNNMAGTPDNVQHTIEWSGLSITCTDASATAYTISLTETEFTQFTYTTTGNCNFQATWTINIRGTGNIDVSGASFPGVAGGIVYNVIGCGRTITVHDTQLNGAILAPCSTLNQPNGVIVGKVVAGNVVASLQINMQNTCPASVTINVPVVTQVPSIQSTYGQFTNNMLKLGDTVDGKTVVAVHEDNTYEFSSPTNWGAHQILFFKTNSLASRTPTQPIVNQPTETSGASVVSMTVAIVIALVALAF